MVVNEKQLAIAAIQNTVVSTKGHIICALFSTEDLGMYVSPFTNYHYKAWWLVIPAAILVDVCT